MRWYIRHRNHVEGPFTDTTVMRWLREKRRHGVDLCEEGYTKWKPIGSTPFAPLAARRRSLAGQIAWAAVGMGAVFTLVIGAVVVSRLVSSSTQTASDPAPEEKRKLQQQIDELDPPLWKIDNTPDAVRKTLTGFQDTTGDVPQSALDLAIWGSRRWTWDGPAPLERTQFALVMKDPDIERGKLMCVSGDVVQIEAVRMEGARFYDSIVARDDLSIVRLLSVGSTAGIVDGTQDVGLCGVVIGRHSYTNRLGRNTPSVLLVGMFDIPENNPR